MSLMSEYLGHDVPVHFKHVHPLLDVHLDVSVRLDVAAHGLVVAEFHQTDLREGHVRAEDAQDPVRHLGEHHGKLDGEARDPCGPEGGGGAGALECGAHRHCAIILRFSPALLFDGLFSTVDGQWLRSSEGVYQQTVTSLSKIKDNVTMFKRSIMMQNPYLSIIFFIKQKF